jgi:Fe-S-cluster containining protein
MKMPMKCKKCGGSCCKQRVSFPPKEWDTLHKYGDAEQIKAKNFVFIGFGDDGYWYSLNEGACPALTANGCAIPYDERTLLCKLYPYVPFKVQGPDGRVVKELFLATKQCPAWREFGKQRDKAEEELNAAQKAD